MPNLPTGPTPVTKTGNVGSVDVFRAAYLFIFGPKGQGNALRGSLMVYKNQQKIAEANGMLNLPIVTTQVTLRGNVGFLDPPIAAQLFPVDPSWLANALRGS